MKTIVNINELVKGLKEINKVKENKEVAMTDNTLILSKNGRTVIAKNNIKTYVEINIDSDIEEEGQVVLTGQNIKIINKMKNHDAEITDNNVKVGNKNLKIHKFDFINFKEKEIENTYTINSKELLRLLEVDYCCDKTDTRPILQGVCFKNNKVCALDGYRMSLRTSDILNVNGEFVLHNSSIKVLKDFLPKKEDVKITINSNNTYTEFLFNNYRVVCYNMEGNYIKFEQITPQEIGRNTVKLNDIKYFKDSIDIINDMTKNYITKGIMKMTSENGQLKISANNLDNTFTDVIEESETNFSTFDVIAFNPKYLFEAFKYVDFEHSVTSVTFNVRNAVSPMVISEDFSLDNFELVLPVRIQNK